MRQQSWRHTVRHAKQGRVLLALDGALWLSCWVSCLLPFGRAADQHGLDLCHDQGQVNQHASAVSCDRCAETITSMQCLPLDFRRLCRHTDSQVWSWWCGPCAAQRYSVPLGDCRSRTMSRTELFVAVPMHTPSRAMFKA